MKNKYFTGVRTIIAVSLCMILGSNSFGVTSKITRQSSGSELSKGKAENTIISSRGTIQLGLAEKKVITKFDDFADAWSINTIIVSGGTVYFGTSPNGSIYKYSMNKLTKLYPLEEEAASEKKPETEASETGKTVEVKEQLTNEHIFSMSTDISGRLLVGISGKRCRLCRFDADKMVTVFEPNDAKYIYAITLDGTGNIYLGTGPEGKIYKLDSLGKNPKTVYSSRDKNILSLLAGHDGLLYAGSDQRGLIYKINPRSGEATVLYDSEQPEIASLLFMSKANNSSSANSGTGASLYAAATSAQIVQTQTQFAASMPKEPALGRPETGKDSEDKGEDKGQDGNGDENENTTNPKSAAEGGRKLEIANIKESEPAKPTQGTPPVLRGARSRTASNIYSISKDGFVTDIFGESAIFFCLAQKGDKLLVGTGNDAQLYSIDPAQEQQAIIFEDKDAAQITAVTVNGDDIYLGTANPAKLIRLSSGFASEGTYISDLIDAGQPAQWGKLQLEADIPPGCRVKVASRSGNVKDVNDPTFSSWTEPIEVTGPIQLRCPQGRFCQYKLILQSSKGTVSPIIREIAVASTIPNLAPRVESVSVSKIVSGTKAGVARITFRTKDDNSDKLIYKIDFRKIGRTSWIELTDDLEAAAFEWDGKTVEDGRYEVRVTASDERDNTMSTKLTGSRISEPVIIDNTGPAVAKVSETTSQENNHKVRVFKIETKDELSAIDKLEYTIDSNADWISSVPDDLVYDTRKEDFTIAIDAEKDLPKGDHVLTIKASDSAGNTTYKTFDVNTD